MFMIINTNTSILFLLYLLGKTLKWPFADVLGVVLKHLDHRYGQLLGTGGVDVEEAWRARSHLVGRRVVLETSDGPAVPGHLRSLSFDAVELDCGEVVPQVWSPERVRGLRLLDGPP